MEVIAFLLRVSTTKVTKYPNSSKISLNFTPKHAVDRLLSDHQVNLKIISMEQSYNLYTAMIIACFENTIRGHTIRGQILPFASIE